MLHIAAGVFIALCLFKAIEEWIDAPRERKPWRRPWRRPQVIYIPTDAEERIIGAALAVCLTLTAAFVLVVLVLAWVNA